MKRILMLIALFALIVHAKAQEKWILEKCIDYALKNNIVIKQYQVNTDYQNNLLKQSKYDRLPDLSANVAEDLSFGRSLTINNTYENYTSSNTWLYASSDILLWNGGSAKHSIKQHEYELKSSLEDLQKAKDDITLNIASGYLDILFAKELLKEAENQVEQTHKQIERTTKLVEAGKEAEGTLLEIEAQLAQEELEVINCNNKLQITYLNLAQLLELEDYTNFDIEVPTLPEIKAQANIIAAQMIYERAVDSRPEIKSAEYLLESYKTQLKIAATSRIPTLSATAEFYDQYLSTFDNEAEAFSDQITSNNREGLSLNLSIPVFNRFQTRTNIENAKLQVINQELELESTKKELRQQIEQAYTNAVAALKKYNAYKMAVKSMELSFNYVEEKFNVGRVNSVEYNKAKTDLATAQSNFIQAKYEFIFRSKILDFYNGIPIQL